MNVVKHRGAAAGSTASDSDVLQRVAAGDLAALGIMYDRYAVALLRFARRVDHADAEDIIQTVFLRVMSLASRFDPKSPSARPWLFTIALRVSQERRRAVRRWTAALLKLAEDPVRRTVRTESDARHDLDSGLARLSVKKRTVLLLAEVEGFTCEEIANMLSVPIGTVWTRLHHARNELRRFHEDVS